MNPEMLFRHFVSHFAECTPWHVDLEAEPGTPNVPELGATMTHRAAAARQRADPRSSSWKSDA